MGVGGLDGWVTVRREDIRQASEAAGLLLPEQRVRCRSSRERDGAVARATCNLSCSSLFPFSSCALVPHVVLELMSDFVVVPRLFEPNLLPCVLQSESPTRLLLFMPLFLEGDAAHSVVA